MSGALWGSSPGVAGPGFWSPDGPDGGTPLLLAPDPLDAEVVYATFPALPSYATEVFRSGDGGQSWTRANAGLEGENVTALAVDPSEPNRLFATTATQGCLSARPGGVFRSEDRGEHWTRLRSWPELGGTGCRSAVLPRADAVLVATRGGVARSTDHGDTWQSVPLTPPLDGFHTLAEDPDDPATLYAVGWYQRFVSHDAGLSWTRLVDPFPVGTPPPVTAFAIAPGAPHVLYELGGDDDLRRSDDGGATWTARAKGRLHADLWTSLLLVDRHDPDTLFGGGNAGALRSRDGGATFHRAARGLPELALGATNDPGVRSLARDALGRVLLGTANGLYRSADAGFHWEVRSMRGVFKNPIRHLLPDPAIPHRIYLTSYDTPILTDDSGGTFERLGTIPGMLRDLDVDPLTPGRLLALSETLDPATGSARDRLLESRDLGRSWNFLEAIPVSVAIAKTAPSTLVRANGPWIYQRQGTGPWTRRFTVRVDEDRAFFSFRELVRHPLRAATVIAIGIEQILHGSDVPLLFVSHDAGLHWRPLDAGGVLAFDPHDPEVGYTAIGRDILRIRFDRPSARRVATIPAGDGVTALAIDRRDASIVAALGQRGVVRTRDGGRHWQSLAPGLPGTGTVPVTRLLQDAGYPRRFYATPASGGLWNLTEAQ